MSACIEGKILAGRFQLLRRLGAGGLAEVWVARDLTAGGEVAIKTLHEHLVADAGLTERFRREMAVTRGLNHPGIVRVFDLYEHYDDGIKRPFFAMELLKGRTLADALKPGAMPAAEARRVGREIALALEHAHRAGVVHRDLKPQNVWITEDGTVKLLDFGLARAAGWSRLTAQSTLMGTPGYIAPEILQGASADARADLYALGATLFEALTGKRAFPSADPYTALRNKGEAPPSPRAVDPNVSEADDLVVRRALEPDPEKRFLDAGQIARALDGQGTAPANPAPAGLTRGDRDVVVLHSLKRQKKALERVCQRLGLPMVGKGWRARLWFGGRNVLVAGASRDTAEAVAALCREEGVAVSVEAARPVGKLRAFTSAHAERITALAGGLTGAGLLALAARLTLVYIDWGPRESLEQRIARIHAAGYTAEKAARMIADLRGYQTPTLLQDFARGLSLVTPVIGALVLLTMLLVALPLQFTKLPPAVGQPLPKRGALGRLRRWLAPRAGKLGLGLGLATLAFLTLASKTPNGTWMRHLFGKNGDYVMTVLFALYTVGSIALVTALGLRAPEEPVQLPAGDAGVRRLERGIARRVEQLRKAADDAQPASGVVLRDLAAAAEGVQRAAEKLADRAAMAADPLAARSEAVTLPPHAGADRDVAVDELLRMAAALDEALAASGKPLAPGSGALDRLRQHLGSSGAPDAPVTPITPTRVPPDQRRVR